MGPKPPSRVGIELVSFVEVARAVREGNIQRRFAGEGPGTERGMDEMGAPGGAVAGH
jgi:hypothetical protein